MDISIQTSRRIRELISNGVITVGVHITRDGNDVWARAVQPHPKLGVLTSTRYSLDEIEQKLESVSVYSLKKSSLPEHPSKVIAVAAQSLYGFKDLGEAIVYAHKRLAESKRNGVRNKLPLDSLTPHDLDLPQRYLFARTAAVGDHLTSAKVASRINSQRETLSVKGAQNLQEWWTRASATQKVMLLTKSRHLSDKGDRQVRIHGYWLDKFETMPFPFWEAEAQVVSEEGGPSAEEEEFNFTSSDEDFPSETEGVTLPNNL